jgi:hypothetical protein
MCVQCTVAEAEACAGTTPICGSNDTCRSCPAHTECPSDVCLPDGSCSDGSDIAYIDPGGSDNAICTKAMPCTRVAKALATNRPFIKFHGSTTEAVTVAGGRDVTFLADPSAKLTLDSGGAILTVHDDNTKLTVYDLSISDGQNVNTIGLVVPAGSGAPSIAMTRVKISNDPGGGIGHAALR